ncbi:hypothetical protein [Micromonospora sp. NPDC048898]|uniref:hypothetical protein n=1 Tax=Micromonospora sp. NPDC048898 TaxID=3364260 RepID=UPI0037219230
MTSPRTWPLRRVFAVAVAAAAVLTLAYQPMRSEGKPAAQTAAGQTAHSPHLAAAGHTTSSQHSAASDEPAPQRADATGKAVAVCLVLGRPEIEQDLRLPASVAQRLYQDTRSYPGPCADYGPAQRVGTGGSVRIATQSIGSRPISMSFVFDKGMLTGLPTELSDGKHCYDVNGDGAITRDTECVHEHEYMLELPQRFRQRVGGPFKWAMLNWDPRGHAPDQIYGVPHFDLHFYLQEEAEAMAIRTGPCGGMNLINCDDYARGRKPVPPAYLPAGYVDIDAVVPGMGNHLGDPAAPEFNGAPFTHTFLYGAYDGDITFYEPMINKAWFDDLAAGRAANSCTPVKLPAAWEVAGWYPTQYCVAYRPNRQDFTVSMTGFVQRSAS